MHEVSVARVIDVPAEEAWRILDDFGGVHRYHPRVERSRIQNGVASGFGAQRVCHFDDGSQIREAITAYEPGRRYTVEITDPGPFPLKTAIAELSVEAVGDSRSRVRFDMAFRPKGGPLGWLMGRTVMKRQFRKILGSVLAGLETHAKTGDEVSRKASRTG